MASQFFRTHLKQTFQNSKKFLERRDGKYFNTPSTDHFFDKRKPSYISGVLEMANYRLYRFRNNLTVALRPGELQNEAKGGSGRNFFSDLYADQEGLKGFLLFGSSGYRIDQTRSVPKGVMQAGTQVAGFARSLFHYRIMPKPQGFNTGGCQTYAFKPESRTSVFE